MPTHKMHIEFTTVVTDPSDAAEMVGMTLLDYTAISAIKITAEGGDELFEDNDEDEDEDDEE